MTSLLLTLCALVGPQEKPHQDRIRMWVEQLGDQKFEVRERAFRSLKLAGRAAIGPVREAARSPNLEVAARAREILAFLRLSQYFLPHLMPELMPKARRFRSGSSRNRLKALAEILAVVTPDSLIQRAVNNADPKIAHKARWKATDCPTRAVAPIVIDLLESVKDNRAELAVLISDRNFFPMLDARVEADLKRLAKEGPAETRFVAELALSHHQGGGLSDPVLAYLKHDDSWYPLQLLVYLEQQGRASDMADLEPLMKRSDIPRSKLTALMTGKGGPAARRILTARLEQLLNSGARTDEGLMVTLGHLEAFEAAPIMLKFMKAGIDTASAAHALSDMEIEASVDPLLAYARTTGSSAYLAKVGGPKIAAEVFGAVRKIHALNEGESPPPHVASLAAAAEALNLADKAPECIKGLGRSEPAGFRSVCLATLSETILPPEQEAVLHTALDKILSRADDPLMQEAARAAARHGMKFQPAWKALLQSVGKNPSTETLRLMADLRCAEIAAAARAALKSNVASRQAAACYALARIGTPEDVRRIASTLTADQPMIVLRTAIDSGDAEAIGIVLDALPEALDSAQWPAALTLLLPLKHEKVKAVLRHAIEQDDVAVRLGAARLLYARDPEAGSAASRTLARLAAPWDATFAAPERWKSPDSEVLATLNAVLDPDQSLNPDETREDRTLKVVGAVRSLGALGDADSRPLLLRYLREGDAALRRAAAESLIDLLGPEKALPILQSAARDVVDNTSILLAMIRAGDGAALKAYVDRLPTQDNHYIKGESELHALDRAANAEAYARTRLPRRYDLTKLQYGLYLRRLERDFGVRFEISPGLQKLKTYYDVITISGSFDLPSALEQAPGKWDAVVCHVHKGDSILLCTPVEAKAYWAKAAKRE